MKQWRRLFFYLTLNILVSACATFAVLLAWDQFYQPLPKNLLPQAFQQLGRSPTEVAQSTLVATQPPQPTPTEAFIVYAVVAGDTFDSIASEHNMSVEELVQVNGFSEVQPLGPGEVLRIPVYPKGSVVIDSVIGAGDLAWERVLLKHRGEGELSLVGWRLEGDNGKVFEFPQFPQLTLFKGGAVNVYTRTGTDTVVDLYWGLSEPVWASGDTINLIDAQGDVHASYTVP
jgi:LysM repeat protein